MSLLDGPHTVTVIPMIIEGKTVYGTWKTVRGEGIEVPFVTVAPHGTGSFSDMESSNTINDQMSVKGKGEWPGGVKSIVVFEGVEYDQEGLPKEFTRGVRTQHYVVRIKRRGAEVK